jgi:hypothetical protein
MVSALIALMASFVPAATMAHTRSTLGIPLTAEAGVQTTFIGLSVQAFANLNAEAPWAGVAGRILLGWMP